MTEVTDRFPLPERIGQHIAVNIAKLSETVGKAYHRIENDGPLLDGKVPLREEWVDLDDVERRWPDKVAEVHQALARACARTPSRHQLV